MIYLLLGHSGSGKSTIASALLSRGLNKITTYTTRAPRTSEINGIDYNFISIDEFKKMEDSGEFIGTTNYVGNFYSTLKSDLEKNYYSKDCVIVVDKEGVVEIKKEFPKAICIYLRCSTEVLEERMKKRDDDYKDIKKRLSVLEDLSSYADYIVNADRDIDTVFEDVLEIVKNTK